VQVRTSRACCSRHIQWRGRCARDHLYGGRWHASARKQNSLFIEMHLVLVLGLSWQRIVFIGTAFQLGMFSHRGLAKNEGRSCGRDDLVDHRRVFPARSINFCYHRFNSIKPLAGRVRSTCCISFVWFFLLFSFLFHLLCGQDVQCHLKQLRRWNVHLMAARDQDLNQTSRALVGLRRAHSHRACRRACVHAVGG
jgi:hypothetical protein